MSKALKITEAAWERLNLGCRVVEIDVLSDCDILLTDIQDSSCGSDYVVIRVPVGFNRAFTSVTQLPVTFREMQLLFSRKVDEGLKEHLAPFRTKTALARVDSKDDLLALTKRLVAGMFSTDRIALDAAFGPEFAAQRYRNWLTQAFDERTAEIYTLNTRASCIGFLMVRPQAGVLRYLLGGLFPDAQGTGLGVHLVAQALVMCESQRFDSLEAAVSSNNAPIISLYQFFGFRLSLPKTHYVFTLSR